MKIGVGQIIEEDYENYIFQIYLVKHKDPIRFSVKGFDKKRYKSWLRPVLTDCFNEAFELGRKAERQKISDAWENFLETLEHDHSKNR